MPAKLTIPTRVQGQDDAQYTQAVRESIKNQRPYLSDDEVLSLSSGYIQPVAVKATPQETQSNIAKFYTDRIKKTSEEKPITISKEQAAKIKSPFNENYVGQENYDKKKAFLYANELPPTLQDPQEAANKVKPTLDIKAEDVNTFKPEMGFPSTDTRTPQQVQKTQEAAKELFKNTEGPAPVDFGFKKDDYILAAQQAIPNANMEQKIAYANVLKTNEDKARKYEAIQLSKDIADEDFNKSIQLDQILKQDRGAVLEQKYGGFKDEINKSIREYIETPQFKSDVVRIAKEKGVSLNQAAQMALDEKSYQYANAPSSLEKNMQAFSDWAATNNIPLDYTATKTLGAGIKGLTDVGAFGAAMFEATVNGIQNKIEGNDFNFGNEFARRNAAMQRQSRVSIPQVQSEKATPFTQGVSDVTSMVAAIGAPMSVVPKVNLFSKAKNILSLGRGGEQALQQGLSAEAQLAAKATTNANKLALDIGKILQSKPANVTANILDNTIQNYIVMGSPTMDAQRQKYLALGFSEEEANRRASGMTFLTNLALALPGTLRPNEMSVMDKVFNLGTFKEGAKAAVKQGVHFGLDITGLRTIEEIADERAMRQNGIEVEKKPLQQELTDKFGHAAKDFAVGVLMSTMGRMKYKQSDMQLAGLAEAFINPEGLSESIKQSVRLGKTSKEEAIAFQSFLNTLKPEYDKAINETTKEGTPKFAPAIAAKVAIERIKQHQAEKALEALENSTEKWKTYETDKDGKQVEKTLYRHSDGKMYDYEDINTKRQRFNLSGAVLDARKSVAQLESGQYVKGKLVSANQMKAITEMNSLNGKAKKGQLEAIDANAPFENVEYDVVDFAKQPEIAKIVEEIKSSGETIPELPSVNDPILNEKGEVIEGRTQVAHAIARGGEKITFMKPLSPEKAKEATNIALGDKLGETQPITEGLGETDIIAINEAKDVFDNHLESNEGDFDGALKAAARDLSERQYTPDETKDMLNRLNGENSVSEAIVDGVYRDKDKAKEPVSSETQIENQDGTTELERATRTSESKSEPKEEKTAKEFIEEHKGEMVERTLLSQRLKPSNIVDSVKQVFNAYENSMREIDSHEKADLNAARLIQEVGMDEAVRMAKSGEIQGAFQSAVLGAKWLEAENNRKAATTPEEIAAAEKEYSEILKYVGKTQEQMGGANSYWATFYSRNENLGLTTADKIARWEKISGQVASAEIREAYEKLDAKNKEQLAEIKKLKEQLESEALQEYIDEIKARNKPKSEKPKETDEQRRQRISDRLFSIAEKVRKSETSGLTLSSPIPPHIISDSIKLLGHAAKGGEKIADAMLRVYELIENSIGKKLSDSDKSKVEKYFNDILKESELPEVDTTEPLSTAVLKELVFKGYDTPELLFAKVKEFYPKGTSDRDIRDSITNYGKEILETQSEIGQKVSAIKSVWGKLSQLEDAQSGKLPFRRSAPENKQFRDERRRLTNELKEAMKNLDVPDVPMEDKWQTRIEASKKRYLNAMNDMLDAIDKKSAIVKNKRTEISDAEIKRLKEEYETVKSFYDEAFGQKEKVQLESLDRSIDRIESLISDADLEIKRKPKEKETLAVIAKREVYDNAKKELLKAREEAGIVEKEQLRKRAEYLEKRNEYYKNRQKTGDYSKKKRKKSPTSERINKLLGENDLLKFEEQKLMYQAEQQALSKWGKARNLIADIWNIPRIQMATGELSFIGVQGRRLSGSYLLKDPKVVKEAIKTMWKAMGSKEGLAEVMSKIKNDDPSLHHAMKASKLDLTETSFKVAATEENTQRIGGAFLWNIVMNNAIIPLAKGVDFITGKDVATIAKELKEKPPYEIFERGAVAYNNYLRAKAFTDFDALMKMDGKSFETNEKEYKLLANYLNTATGRGELPLGLESQAELLAKLLFSPRNFSSELQLSTTPFGIGKLASMQAQSDMPLKNLTKEVSAVKEAAKHQVRYQILQTGLGLTLTGILYGLMGSTDDNEDGTGVELDPRSTKFGSITFEDGKIVDFFNGGLRYAILASRIGSQKYKTADKVKMYNDTPYYQKGQLKDLGEGYIPDGFDLFMQIAANKVNPSLGTAFKIYKAKPKTELDKAIGVKRDRFGNRVDFETTFKELMMPIYFTSIKESIQNDPSALDVVGQLQAFLALASYRNQNKEKQAREEQEKVKKDLELYNKKRAMGLIK